MKKLYKLSPLQAFLKTKMEGKNQSLSEDFYLSEQDSCKNTTHRAVFLLALLCVLSTQFIFGYTPKANVVTPEKQELNDTVIMKLFSKGGPYEQFKPENEILSERNETTKVFDNKDGTRSSLFTAGPSHYKENGVWKTSSNQIILNSTQDFPFANIHNKGKTYYGNIGTGLRYSDYTENMTVDISFLGISRYDAYFQQTKNEVNFPFQTKPSLTDKDNLIAYDISNDVQLRLEQLTGAVTSYYQINRNIFEDDNSGFIGFTEQLRFNEPVTYKENQKTPESLDFINTSGKTVVNYGKLFYYGKDKMGVEREIGRAHV